ncbi:MAG: phage tail protein [Desulfobacteraceae bacterium]|jgi:phage tail-like protein
MMKNQEFHKLIFETADQWKSGLYSRLKITEKEGLTLFSRPAFDKWLLHEVNDTEPLCLSIDPCGVIYFMDRRDCRLYRYSRINRLKELIPSISGCGPGSDEVTDPARILMDRHTMWLLDRGNQRVIAFDTDLFQQKYIITSEIKLVDLALDGHGHLYVLETGEKSSRVTQYLANGTRTGLTFGQEQLLRPTTMALGKQNRIYVADLNGFLRFSIKGDFIDCVGDVNNFYDDGNSLEPHHMVVSLAGSIFVLENVSGAIHEFGSLGGYLGKLQMPEPDQVVYAIALDRNDELFVGSHGGISHYTLSKSFVGETGEYYSQTLDKGLETKPWHRLDMDAILPENTSIDIRYYSTDSLTFKRMIDNIHSSGQSDPKKIDEIENMLAPLWSEPESPKNGMLFRGEKAAGRYLWLKLTLTTFHEASKPALKSMVIYYPRISYLRYLPATYQEDPISSDFLERFLSAFETVFYDFEKEIKRLFRYFDPAITPEDFLPWLSSWLKLALEEDWTAEVKRKLIARATAIYKKKGTPGGIAEFIEVVIGQRPIIYEHTDANKPFVLGGRQYVGDTMLVSKGAARGFRLGDDSILGLTAIVDVPQRPEDLFKPFTNQFMVMLNLDREQYRRHEQSIKRILDEQKPAHTNYTLRLISDAKLGHSIYLGVNTRLTGLKPFCVGISSIPGKSILVIKGEKGGRLDRNSIIGSGFTLT